MILKTNLFLFITFHNWNYMFYSKQFSGKFQCFFLQFNRWNNIVLMREKVYKKASCVSFINKHHFARLCITGNQLFVALVIALSLGLIVPIFSKQIFLKQILSLKYSIWRLSFPFCEIKVKFSLYNSFFSTALILFRFYVILFY